MRVFIFRPAFGYLLRVELGVYLSSISLKGNLYKQSLILCFKMFIIIKVTCPDVDEARKISAHLLREKFISSANFFPIKSVSSWTGKIQEVDEMIVLLKTRKENWEKVRDEVKKIHTYKVSCITKIDVEANDEYEDWVRKQTG
jgi:periplasmic divalent cation tolerance protein